MKAVLSIMLLQAVAVLGAPTSECNLAVLDQSRLLTPAPVDAFIKVSARDSQENSLLRI